MAVQYIYDYGVGSKIYSSAHLVPYSGSNYVQEDIVQYRVNVPPQSFSNYNSGGGGYGLNVYQMVNQSIRACTF